MRDPHIGSAVVAQLNGVSFSYEGSERGSARRWALDSIALSVCAGEYIALAGPNGSGKSTLGRILAGLAAPDKGCVQLMGVNVYTDGALPEAYDSLCGQIGAVFQNPEDQIIATSVGDDVAFAPENLAVPRREIESRVGKALGSVGMSHREHSDPTRMSGGEQQRIAIAGILAMQPAMLVLDEPTAMLDPQARADVLQILDDLHACGITIIHITHKPEEIARAERVIRMERGTIISDEQAQISAKQTDTGQAKAASSASQAGADRDGAEIVCSDGGASASERREPQEGERASESVKSYEEGARGEPIIRVRNLSYAYPNAPKPIISDFSLDVSSAQIVAIMGENGSGKTTLTRLLTGFLHPLSGEITIAGYALAREGKRRCVMMPKRKRYALRQRVGLVMQHPERQLFAHTVYEDVAYGPRNQGLDETSVQTAVKEALALAGIEHLAQRDPQELSGGEQRLAAIAGVLACQPDILILDEPTVSLDSRALARIHTLLQDARARGVTIVIVTHSHEEAHALADRIVTMPSTHFRHSSDSAHHDNDCDSSDLRHEHGNPDLRHGHNACTQASSSQSAAIRRPFLARLDPRGVFVAFTALVLSMFAISTFPQLIGAGALTCMLVYLSGENLGWIARSMRIWLPMLILMALINLLFVRTGEPVFYIGSFAIMSDGVRCAAIYSLRFALAVTLGIVLMKVFTPMTLVDSVAAMLAPLQRLGARVQELALVAGLALRFLPTLTAETRSIVTAQAARGGKAESGSVPARLKALSAIAIPAFAGALRHADNLGCALEARCYRAGAERTRRRELKMRLKDWLFVVCVAVCVIGLRFL